MKMNTDETQEVIKAIESSSLSASQVIELIVCSQKTEKVVDVAAEITLTIDYTKTIEQAIADGNYDWRNPEATSKNFPISSEMVEKKVEISTKIFHFNCDISSQNVISEMDKDGYCPATLMELLAMGFLFPELQRQFPIVALSSICSGAYLNSFVPCLSIFGSERGLYLIWFADDWDDNYRFLGVRK